jgi:HK97 family phage major capsid protein
MSDRISDLMQKRANTFEHAKAMLDKAESEDRALNAEEDVQYDKMNAEIDDCDKRIKDLELEAQRALRAENYTEAVEEILEDVATGELNPKSQEARDAAVLTYIVRGMSHVPVEYRETLQVDLDAGGGFLTIPKIYVNKLIESADAIFRVMSLYQSFPCPYASSLGYPQRETDIGDFTMGGGEIKSATEDTALTFKERELKPRDVDNKVVRVSKRLIENAEIDIVGYVLGRLNFKLNKLKNQMSLTGHGADEPLGMFVASDNGISTTYDVDCASTTVIAGDDLIEIQHELPEVYQLAAKWLFHGDAIKMIRKLKDGEGQYLWQPGLIAGQPNTILGKEVIRDDQVPNTFTTGLYVGMYADFSHYWMCHATDSLQIQRLDELYALTNQIGLLTSGVAIDGMPSLGEAFRRLTLA